MRNKITDLNNHLFEELERLMDNDLTGDKLDQEIERAQAINGVAGRIIESAKVTLDAMKLISQGRFDEQNLPGIFSDQTANRWAAE